MRRPLPGLAVLLAALPAACRLPGDVRAAPGPHGDLAIEASARALPGYGVGLAFAQRVGGEAVAIEAEVGLEVQRLDDGPRGNDWDRVWGGLRWMGLGGGPCLPVLRLGVTWMRADSDPAFLDADGDYGGLYLGLSVDAWRLGAWSTGPSVEVMAVDAEGDRGGSGVLVQAAWFLRRRF